MSLATSVAGVSDPASSLPVPDIGRGTGGMKGVNLPALFSCLRRPPAKPKPHSPSHPQKTQKSSSKPSHSPQNISPAVPIPRRRASHRR